MNDKIIIKDLLVDGILGILPQERVAPQPILVNLTLFTDIREAAKTEDLTQSIDYAAVARRVTEHVKISQRLLVERLASDIAQLILDEYNAGKVIVRVEKPNAIPNAGSVGVEIVRDSAENTP